MVMLLSALGVVRFGRIHKVECNDVGISFSLFCLCVCVSLSSPIRTQTRTLLL